MDYRIATTEEKKAADCCEDYDLLIGPNGFECLLTEPEDRRWSRDGRKVIAELNRIQAIVKAMNGVSRHQCNRFGPLPDCAVHPLTCGNDSNHGNLFPLYEDGIVKLICPDCDYTQGNAAMFSL